MLQLLIEKNARLLMTATAWHYCANTVAPTLTPDSTFKDTLTMKAGTSTTANITVAAFPEPSVTLTFNGGSVVDDKRVSCKLAQGKLSFVVQKVQKEDAGQYVLTVENQSGKATATITVVVLGEWTRLHSFTRSFVHSFIHSFIHSSSIHPSIHSLHYRRNKILLGNISVGPTGQHRTITTYFVAQYNSVTPRHQQKSILKSYNVNNVIELKQY